jgi:pilus assembly protein Flp/PilA
LGFPVTAGKSRHSLEEFDMKNFAQKVKRFLKSEDGPTAVEYAVMLALIIIVCLTAITAVGTQAAAQFNNIATQIGGI